MGDSGGLLVDLLKSGQERDSSLVVMDQDTEWVGLQREGGK